MQNNEKYFKQFQFIQFCKIDLDRNFPFFNRNHQSIYKNVVITSYNKNVSIF